MPPHPFDRAVQPFGFATSAGDEADAVGVGRRRVVANAVQHTRSLAHQIGIRRNAEAHQWIGFEHLGPGRLRGEFSNGVAAEKGQHGANGRVVLGGERFDTLAKCRPLLSDALGFALAVDADDVLGGIP